MSLQNKLSISMSITFVLILLIVAGMTGYSVQRQITRSVQNGLLIQNQVAAVAVNQAMETYSTEMRMAAAADALLSSDTPRIQRYLETVLARNPRLTTLAMLTPEGYRVASTGRWAGEQLPLLLDQTRDEFLLARDAHIGRVIVTGPVMCKGTIPTLVIYAPIASIAEDNGGTAPQNVGVVAMVASLDPINELLAACNNDTSAPRIMQIVDKRGRLILSDQQRDVVVPLLDFGASGVERLAVKQSVLDVSIVHATEASEDLSGDLRGETDAMPGIAAAHRLDRYGDGKTLDWSIVSAMSVQDIRARARAIVVSILWLSLGVLPAVIAICWWLARRFTMPIRRASERASAIAQGELTLEPLEVHGRDELAELAYSMNHMSVELKKAADAAKTAVRLKSEFLANMSHEIRTPMSAILGHAELLNSPELPSDQRNASVETIQRNGNHLLAVLNDILDVSKLEAGKVELEHTPLNAIQVVNEVIALVRPRAEEKQLYLKAEYSSQVPEHIRGDEVRLRQILINLVGNAIKFTRKGGVTISVRWIEDLLHPVLRIAVTDTGVGIPPVDLERIFEAFDQGDTSVSRRFGGTGLGLRIANEFAKLMGTGVQVSSRVGVGSTFRFDIDVDRADDTVIVSSSMFESDDDRVTNAVVSKHNVRILLADDGEDNRRLFEFILERAGMTVMTVENGVEAVEQVRSALYYGRPFDVILMDMQMPLLDGYMATQQLRESGVTTPIIAFTASALDSDRDKCIEAGCSDHLGKPIDNTLLIERCLEWYERGSRQTQHSEDQGRPATV